MSITKTYNQDLQTNNSRLQTILNAVNALPEAGGESEQATPIISVSSSGLITATAGTKSATQQLTTQAATTITPSEEEQTAAASQIYTTGIITVAAIPSNYINSNNIKNAEEVAY